MRCIYCNNQANYPCCKQILKNWQQLIKRVAQTKNITVRELLKHKNFSHNKTYFKLTKFI